MRVLSVSVGRPRAVEHAGSSVMTGIFKQPQAGRVRVCEQQLEGDGQADRVNHGGLAKAVYAYPFEHYAHWSHVLGRPLAVHGQFGENLTIEGLLERDAQIGDTFQLGTAKLMVSQPRKPCFKLGIRLDDATFPKQFFASARVGFYLRVVELGDIGAGDAMQLAERGPYGVSVADVWRSVFVDRDDADAARRVLQIPWLSEEFREPLEKRLGLSG